MSYKYGDYCFGLEELQLREDGECSARIWLDQDFTKFLLQRYKKWDNVTIKRVKKSLIDWLILHHGDP